MIFRDRSHAGQLLARMLQRYKTTDSILLALPRGGVPIAAEIAKDLHAPLVALIVRKVGAPFQSELAVGAICEEADPIWNDRLMYQLGLEPDDLEGTVSVEREKIKSQITRFRESRSFPSVARKTVIIVDDGLATGATMSAAIKYIEKKSPERIVVAVPVAATSTATKLRGKVDEVVVIEEREDLMSVGQWYQDFSQVTDEEVVALLKKNADRSEQVRREIEIPLDNVTLKGDLTTFSPMKALIIFAHGSGSSRKSPRNQQVAHCLNERGMGTLLFDLLTDQEARDRRNVFNIDFLGRRLALVTKWLRKHSDFKTVPIGFFGASTGAGAAIQAAYKMGEKESIFAIVSRGGRPDLAGRALKAVKTPTLLLVGGLDFGVIEFNQQAKQDLTNCELSIVPGATHLFEEPGALEEVSKQAAKWFGDHLPLGKQTVQSVSRTKLESAILN